MGFMCSYREDFFFQFHTCSVLMGNNYIFVFWCRRLVMRPNSAGSLLVDLLGTADFREREGCRLGALLFSGQVNTEVGPQFPVCRHGCFPGLSSPGPGLPTHIWVCGWVFFFFFFRRIPKKEKTQQPLPTDLPPHPSLPNQPCLQASSSQPLVPVCGLRAWLGSTALYVLGRQ